MEAKASFFILLIQDNNNYTLLTWSININNYRDLIISAILNNDVLDVIFKK